MLSCLPTSDVSDLIFSQFSIDCCQKCVCFRGHRWGGLSWRPQTPSWTTMGHAGQRRVTNRSCPDQRTCFHIHLPLATPQSTVLYLVFYTCDIKLCEFSISKDIMTVNSRPHFILFCSNKSITLCDKYILNYFYVFISVKLLETKMSSVECLFVFDLHIASFVKQ